MNYPAIGFRGPFFTLWRTKEALETQYLSAVTSGELQSQKTIDRGGEVYRITSAVPEGIQFWRRLLNPLIGQRVQLRLELEATGERWNVEQLRAAVRREFREWTGWQSRADYLDAQQRIDRAEEIGELLQVLSSALDKPSPAR